MRKEKQKKFPFKDGFTAVLEKVTGEEWWAELRFHPVRLWRFDYATSRTKTAIEIDGGIFTRGRHSNGVGQKKDMEKMNAAIEEGWAVLHYIPDEKLTSVCLEQVKKVVKKRSEFLQETEK